MLHFYNHHHHHIFYMFDGLHCILSRTAAQEHHLITVDHTGVLACCSQDRIHRPPYLFISSILL